MNDREAFLRAIRANPDDDTVRLVFADWLDEHDDPLGEFIRVQIELEPIRYRIDNPRAVELHRHEEKLLHAHRETWLGGVAEFGSEAEIELTFRRGFPDRAVITSYLFTSRGRDLFAACPLIREVALHGVADRCDASGLPPLLTGLDLLEIADWPTRTDARVLVPRMTNVPCFRFWGSQARWAAEEFVRCSTASWPWDVELIQANGGGSYPNEEEAQQLDSIASETNRRFGREVIRVSRPCDALFPLNGAVAPDICAGYLPDGNAAVAACGFVNWVLVVFDEDGRVEHLDVHPSPYSAPGHVDRYAEATRALDRAFRRWVNDSLQLEPGLIWVREFTTNCGLEVSLWPQRLRYRVSNPEPYPPSENHDFLERGPFLGLWHERGGDARRWLDRRNFVIKWGRERWADWRGTIHSS